jgi:hypothetical protein
MFPNFFLEQAVDPNNNTSQMVNLNISNITNNNDDQIKRIKQLNDVKLSLYSLLFATNNASTPHSGSSAVTNSQEGGPTGLLNSTASQQNKRSLDDQNQDVEMVNASSSVTSPDPVDSSNCRLAKRPKTNSLRLTSTGSIKSKTQRHKHEHRHRASGATANGKHLVLCSNGSSPTPSSTSNHIILGDDTNVINNCNYHHLHHHHHHLHHHHLHHNFIQ